VTDGVHGAFLTACVSSGPAAMCEIVADG
jgi:hypothetical protein